MDLMLDTAVVCAINYADPVWTGDDATTETNGSSANDLSKYGN